ncbi:Putative ribonuclease H protein At1g65750 [Linum perenne]
MLTGATIGGVIRNAQGSWVAGFTNCIGRGSALLAELTALRDGLTLVWILGYREVQVESDCTEVVELVESIDLQNHPQAVIGSGIQEILRRNWKCSLKHVCMRGK